MRALDFRDRWMIVTGASAGLGEAIARQLASQHGANLVLVARRRERLEVIADAVRRDHDVHAVVIEADLAEPDAPRRIVETAAQDRQIYGLVSCAGMHWYGKAHEIPMDVGRCMVQVNALAPIELIRLLVPDMLRAGRGAVLVITSVGAWLPAPFQSLYAGTKAMLQTYAHNLYHELGGADATIAVSVCSPAGIWTDMLIGSTVFPQVQQSRLMRWSIQSPDEVARVALDGLRRRKYATVPGRVGQALQLATKLLPRRLLGAQNVHLYRP
jgi:short-subunit dehydrogenase